MNRDEYRQIKGMSKEELERWLNAKHTIMYNTLRKEFNNAYKDELDNSIQNFIAAIGYTLHFNEDLHLEKDELASFMDDLFVSVDLFRSGEYNPEDYTDQLKEDGIILSKYNYSKIFDNLGKNISTELKNRINEFKTKDSSKEEIFSNLESLAKELEGVDSGTEKQNENKEC